MHTPANPPILKVHRAVMAVAGPEALAGIVRPLTCAEQSVTDLVLAALNADGTTRNQTALDAPVQVTR